MVVERAFARAGVEAGRDVASGDQRSTRCRTETLMSPIRLLVDSLADEDGFNAQMTSARDIMSRLDPARFHVTTFCVGKPDARLVQRPNTRLIQLPQRRQTPRILAEFVTGKHDNLY